MLKKKYSEIKHKNWPVKKKYFHDFYRNGQSIETKSRYVDRFINWNTIEKNSIGPRISKSSKRDIVPSCTESLRYIHLTGINQFFVHPTMSITSICLGFETFSEFQWFDVVFAHHHQKQYYHCKYCEI